MIGSFPFCVLGGRGSIFHGADLVFMAHGRVRHSWLAPYIKKHILRTDTILHMRVIIIPIRVAPPLFTGGLGLTRPFSQVVEGQCYRTPSSYLYIYLHIYVYL